MTTTQQPSIDASLPKADLLSEIDWEIARLDASAQKPDSTYWVLAVALATCIWLLIDTCANPQHTWRETVWLFLLGSLLFDSARHLYRELLPMDPRNPASSSRFFYTLKSASNRPAMILIILRSCALLCIATLFSSPSHSIFYVFPWCYYTAILLLFLVGFILTFCKFPVPSRPPPNSFRANAVSFIWLLFSLVALYGYSVGFIQTRCTPTIAGIQASTLLVASAYLMTKLARGRHPNPLLASLVEIRRDLALCEIDPSTAQKRTELALLGLRVEDVLQREINEFLSGLNAITERSADLESSIRTLDDLVQQITAKEPPDSAEFKRKKEYLRALLTSITMRKKEIDELVKQSQTQSTQLLKRSRLVKTMSSAATADLERIYANILQNIDKCRESSNALDKTADEFVERAKSATADIPELKQIEGVLKE